MYREGDSLLTYCADITKCSFYKEYKKRQQDQGLTNFALRGIVNLYCHGMKQGQCIRKKVSQIFGSNKVPVNMMPIGKPIRDTNDNNWPKVVKKMIF